MKLTSLSNRQAKNEMYRIEHFIFYLSIFYIYLFPLKCISSLSISQPALIQPLSFFPVREGVEK